MDNETEFDLSEGKYLDDFIIQNFRSWSGKHYFKLNSLNFLFGINSSGKSSLINAISLFQQSLKPESTVPETLLGNGFAINLGKIEDQYFGGITQYKKLRDMRANEAETSKTLAKPADIKSKALRNNLNLRSEDLLGFGYRCGSQTKGKILNGPEWNDLGTEDFSVLMNGIETLEISTFYDPATGTLKAIELRNGAQLLFKLEQLFGGMICLEYGTDKKLWKMFHENFFRDRLEDLVDILSNKRSPSMAFSYGFADLFNNEFNTLRNLRGDYFERIDILKALKGQMNRLNDYLALSEKKEEKISNKSFDEFVAHYQTKLAKKIKTKSDSKKGGKPDISEEGVVSLESLEDAVATILSWFNDHDLIVTQDKRSAYSSIIKKFSPIYNEIAQWSDFDFFYDFISKKAKTIIKISDPGLDNTLFYRSKSITYVLDSLINLNFLMASDQRVKNIKSLNSKSSPRSMSDFFLISTILENFIFPDGFSITTTFSQVASHFKRNFLANCIQIGPYRERPDRVAVIDTYKEADDVGISAQNLLILLHNNYRNPKKISEVNEWLKKMEIGYSIRTIYRRKHSIQDLELIDNNGLAVSILDVGYGVSQVLPIILQTLLAKDSTITIEQPELHIHPKLQSNLADLFIWSAKNNNNKFIIETHSEHIILRLQRRQRDKDEPAADKKSAKPRYINWVNIFTSVNINVVEKLGKPLRSVNSELKINSKGEFNGEWPGGFFEERYVEKGII